MDKYRDIPAFREYKEIRAIYTTAEWNRWPCNETGETAAYDRLASLFGTETSRIVRIPQTHTDKVRVIEEENAGEGVVRIAEEGYDGMITNVIGIALCTVEADCVPVYLYDPVKRVIGMIHSGWKGCAGCIAEHAVALMQDKYGTDPADVIAAFGPCICGDCYEVGEELIDPFRENFNEITDVIFKNKGNGKYLLNLTGAIRHSLLRAGLAGRNIHESPACTFETKDLCSWRRDKDKLARMLTGIMLV